VVGSGLGGGGLGGGGLGGGGDDVTAAVSFPVQLFIDSGS
jgi:hypothetical protein